MTAGGPAWRIRAALTAFCAGDALGAPWEGRPPSAVDPARLDELPALRDWGAGVTTDDTAQLLLVAEVLVDGADETAFLRRLSAAFPTIRGSGPTTTAAVRSFQATGATVATGGSTNGAVMRALPIGWAYRPADTDRRRDATARLTRTTHADPRAVLAAAVTTALGSVSAEEDAVGDLVAVAVSEAESMAGRLGLAPGGWRELRDAAEGSWRPPAAGIGLDAVQTVAAVVSVLAAGGDLRSSLHRAVLLGGDTDTVAAVVGGVVGARRPGDVAGLPSLARTELPDSGLLDALAAGLAARRGAG